MTGLAAAIKQIAVEPAAELGALTFLTADEAAHKGRIRRREFSSELQLFKDNLPKVARSHRVTGFPMGSITKTEVAQTALTFIRTPNSALSILAAIDGYVARRSVFDTYRVHSFDATSLDPVGVPISTGVISDMLGRGLIEAAEHPSYSGSIVYLLTAEGLRHVSRIESA